MAYTLNEARKNLEKTGIGYHTSLIDGYSQLIKDRKSLVIPEADAKKVAAQFLELVKKGFFKEAFGMDKVQPAEGSEELQDDMIQSYLGIEEDDIEKALKNQGQATVLLQSALRIQQAYEARVRTARFRKLDEPEREKLVKEFEDAAGATIKPEVRRNPQQMGAVWNLYDRTK